MSAQRVIALLGRRDEPTDAVEEYCRHLSEALATHGFQLDIRRVPWNEHGWAASLDGLRLQAEAWRGTWVLVQYTALAWSARGFPARIFRVFRVLRQAGARIAIVFHDVEPFPGTRLIDRVRRRLQLGAMEDAAAFSDCNVFTIATDHISWIGQSDTINESFFIPVGANLPLPFPPQDHDELHSPPAIGVYSITGSGAGDSETRTIIAAVRFASQRLGKLRLLVFGRHAEVREVALREALRDLPIELQVEGVIDESELANRFAASDGLPVIALQGKETAPPITEAGVVLVSGPLGDAALQTYLGEALVRVLSENDYRRQLARRSRAAQEKYFSWQAIAARYAEFLQNVK